MRFISVVAALVFASSPLIAQDAVKTLPQNYKVQFENEYVRVTRVYYPPHAKLPGHTHTSLASAYVYLTDGGPVAFKHIGLEYGAVTRPATVARSFRVFRGLEEIHEVENLAATPSEFLRVEFKTDPGPDPRTLRGKFLPPEATSEPLTKVEFENAQLRVTRAIAPAGSKTTLAAAPRPSIVVSLSSDEPGRALWMTQGQELTIGGSGRLAEVLRFELQTAVQASR